MKNMKKSVLILGLAAGLLVLGSGAYAMKVTQPPAGANQLLQNTHFIFSESSSKDDGNMQTSTFEAWFNELGEYRMNVLSGPYAGDYEVWDGENVYQYRSDMKNFNIIPNKIGVDTAPVPHLFLAPVIAEKIKDDYKKGKMKNIKKGTYENNLESVEFDSQEKLVMHSVHKFNNKVNHELTMEKVENNITFDPGLLKIN